MDTIKSIKQGRSESNSSSGRIEASELLIALAKEKFNPELGIDKLTLREQLLLEVIGEVLDAMDYQRYSCFSKAIQEPGIEIEVYSDGRVQAKI